MALELVPLATVTIRLKFGQPIPKGPAGTRIVVEVLEGRVEGERIKGTLEGPGGDWFVVGPDGTGTLDVRAQIRTDDGALVYAHYLGRTDGREAVKGAPMYVAPTFETGDERYAWLNRIQAVGKGIISGESLTYEWYEVR